MLDLFATPLDTDIAYNWIEVLFPSSTAGATGGAYAAAFAVFTSMLTLLGSIFIAWHIIQGIVLSATTGKIMGERFHQIWAPLRVVLGFGLLVPISGGFSSIHYLLREVVGRAAIQMGNAPIQAYISSITAPSDGKKVTVVSIKGRTVFDVFLEKEVCYAVVDGLNTSIWASFWSSATGSTTRPETVGTEVSNGYRYNYGNCGSVTFITPSVDETKLLAAIGPKIDEFAAARYQASNEMMMSVRGAINAEALGKYFATHDVKQLKGEDILKAFRTEGIVPANLAEVKNQAAAKWNSSVSNAASKVYDSVMTQNGKDLNDRITKFGFMAAGSFERALAQASSLSVTLANSSPTTTAPDVSDKYKAPVEAARNAIISTPSLNDESKGDGAFAYSDGSDPMSSIYSFLSPSIASMKAGVASSSGDPIGDMISFGHNILAVWEGGMLALMGGLILANAAEAGAFASIFSVVNVATLGGEGVLAYTAAKTLATTWHFIVPQLYAVFGAVLIVGIIQAFVLPMLPMIMVFIMGISWLILFLEAAIAGVLWAFAFIRMDGQDLFDKNQAPGVTLLFNLFLRPAISMLAFIGGLKLLPEVMNSLSILWDNSFDAQTEGGGIFGMTSLIQWVVGLVMFTWMQWHLTMRIFGLIPTIADRVGHWMGFGQMHAYNDGHETTAAIGAAVAAGQVSRQLKAMPARMSEAQQKAWSSRANAVREAREARLAAKRGNNSN